MDKKLAEAIVTSYVTRVLTDGSVTHILQVDEDAIVIAPAAAASDMVMHVAPDELRDLAEGAEKDGLMPTSGAQADMVERITYFVMDDLGLF
jgi:hypothetical protein